jgi:hypothetical protein
MLGDIIYNYSCLAILVKELSYGSKLFLSRRVPDLQLYKSFAFDLQNEGTEFNSYCNLMITLEGALSQHLHKATLTNA